MVSAGKAVAIPYNGSVARLSFGPTANNRLRKFIAEGDFDVLHIHEPMRRGLSMLALRIAEGPIVATFHTSTTKSLVLSTFQGVLAPYLEKISAGSQSRSWRVVGRSSPSDPTRSKFPTASMSQRLPRPICCPATRAKVEPFCSSVATTNLVAIILIGTPSPIKINTCTILTLNARTP